MYGKKALTGISIAVVAVMALSAMILVPPVIGQDAKKIYGDRCALCHGAEGDGKGVIMQTDAFDAKFWKNGEKSDDAAVTKAIVEGKGRMPAIPLSPEETKAVVEYMKSNMKK